MRGHILLTHLGVLKSCCGACIFLQMSLLKTGRLDIVDFACCASVRHVSAAASRVFGSCTTHAESGFLDHDVLILHSFDKRASRCGAVLHYYPRGSFPAVRSRPRRSSVVGSFQTGRSSNDRRFNCRGKEVAQELPMSRLANDSLDSWC